jgi:hypothetical protein
MNNPLDVNTGLPIFLLTNNHPEKFFEKATYQFEPQAVSNINKLKQVFFSPENVKYLQEKMIFEVSATTKKYKIPYQNERDLRMIMETIYFDKTRNIGYDLNEQLSELNLYVVKFCVPLIINEINVYLNYLDDISKPRKLNILPTSTGNLRSVSGIAPPTTLNENIFLPDNQMKYTYSTNGDVAEYPTPKNVMFAPSMASTNSAGGSNLTPSNTWLPSAAIFQDDPYYIRNSLLSPFAMKPRTPKDTYPTDKNGLFSNAGGSDYFLSNYNDNKYANADIQADAPPVNTPSAAASMYKRK